MFTTIEDHLNPAEVMVKETLTAIGNGALDPTDQSDFASWLMGGLAAVPQIRAIAVIPPDLKSWSVHRGTGLIEFDPVSRANSATVARVIGDAAQRGGKPYWGEIVYVEGSALINYRALFLWPGGGRAMLVIAISTSDLSRFLAKKSAASDWSGFILYDKSQVLAHEYIDENPGALTAAQPVLPLSVLPDPVLRRIWDGVDGKFFEAAADAGAQVRFDPPDNPTHIYIVSRTDRFGDTPWYYGAYTELDLVNRGFARAFYSGLIALALAAAAVLVAIWFGQRLAQPLRRTAIAAGQIGRLELDGLPPLPRSGVREFDQQATAFNQMAEGLRSFSTYVPKQLVDVLARRGFRSDIPAQAVEVTVLFTDIAGFTSQTEHMTAEETGAMLNAHFGLLGEVIAREQGIIDKYIGDSIMAFWVPDLTEGVPAARAVAAARAIGCLLEADNCRRCADNKEPIRIRIGIHTGLALVGNIGGKGRVDFTVVGDTVNIAQRLEGYGRNIDAEADCVIVASDETVRHLPVDWPRENLGELPIRGRTAAIRGWRILPHD